LAGTPLRIVGVRRLDVDACDRRPLAEGRLSVKRLAF
jgi:hypothetical protein